MNHQMHHSCHSNAPLAQASNHPHIFSTRLVSVSDAIDFFQHFSFGDIHLFVYFFAGGSSESLTLSTSYILFEMDPPVWTLLASSLNVSDSWLVQTFHACSCTSWSLLLQFSKLSMLKDLDRDGIFNDGKNTAVHLWSLPWLWMFESCATKRCSIQKYIQHQKQQWPKQQH